MRGQDIPQSHRTTPGGEATGAQGQDLIQGTELIGQRNQRRIREGEAVNGSGRGEVDAETPRKIGRPQNNQVIDTGWSCRR